MSARCRYVLAAVLLAAATCHLAGATTGSEQHRTLALIGDEAARQTYSRYLAAVEAASGEFDVRLARDPKLQLRHWDDLLYETVIILHPEAKGLLHI